MLTSQLDSQRMYFEEQLVRLDQQTSTEVSERQPILHAIYAIFLACFYS